MCDSFGLGSHKQRLLSDCCTLRVKARLKAKHMDYGRVQLHCKHTHMDTHSLSLSSQSVALTL